MTLDEYMGWLENRIAVVGTELEMLLNARKALAMAHDELGKPKAPISKPREKRLPAPKAKPDEANYSWQKATEEVMRLIRVVPDPLNSGDIIMAYYGGREPLTKREKDRIYAILSQLKTQGVLLRSSQGLWTEANPSAALKEQNHA